MNLGERLFELRKAKNLTQDDIAEKLNVTRQTISKWETNQSTPDFDKIVPLCDLYEISPNELLNDEKESIESKNNNNSFDRNEAKKNIFTRKKYSEDNYENMTKNQIKRKSAEVVSTSILIFFFAVAFAGIGTTVMMWNPVVVGFTFLILIGWGVIRIVKYYMSVPEFEKTKEEKKQDMIVNIIRGIGIAIYFIVNFITMAWNITWVIFIIIGIVEQIVKLIFILKKGDEDEE